MEPKFSLCEEYAYAVTEHIPRFYLDLGEYDRAPGPFGLRVVRPHATESIFGYCLCFQHEAGALKFFVERHETKIDHVFRPQRGKTLAWIPDYLKNSHITILLGDEAHPNMRVLFFRDMNPPEMMSLHFTIEDAISRLADGFYPFAEQLDHEDVDRMAEEDDNPAVFENTHALVDGAPAVLSGAPRDGSRPP